MDEYDLILDRLPPDKPVILLNTIIQIFTLSYLDALRPFVEEYKDLHDSVFDKANLIK